MVILETAKEMCIAEDEKVSTDRFSTCIQSSHKNTMFRARNGHLCPRR
jgi:hypothetical protein